MNRKKLTALFLCVCLSISISPLIVHAQDDNGKIDLYEAFSSKEDRLKTEVGSRIYKWSMHLPDDGIIYKSDKANYFNMSTTSYQANIQLEVNKNDENITLEEYLYKIQNVSDYYNYWYYSDKEYAVDISTDEMGHKFIRTIKSNQFYDYYMVTDAAEDLGDYTENRIYIDNNYIYNLTVNMTGQYYKQHEEMFDKLVSSFKLSFDEKNPYIKELSDSVSSVRQYKNASYGWQMTMSPYWRVEGTPNARIQNFSPVYSDEELSIDNTTVNKEAVGPTIIEGITVKLISSSAPGETAVSWAANDLTALKNSYNSEVYEILSNSSKVQNNTDIYHTIIKYKTVTKNPYIEHKLYVIGNGYKYLVTATMKEEKYNDANKRLEFENMLNSFALDKDNISKYLGKIISAGTLIDINSTKEFKMKKYDFSTKLTKAWNTSNQDYYMYYDKYMMGGYSPIYTGDVSNNEFIYAMEPQNNITVTMSAGLNTNDITDAIKQQAEILSKDSEVQMGLAKVKIQSLEYSGAQLYYIEKEYDLNAINKFINEDSTKIYDLKNLQNQYQYIVKIGKDTYTQNITLSVANTTSQNKSKVKDIWSNTVINKINYSIVNTSWKQHTLGEFKK
jgi:hypothetical protein